MLKLGIDSQPDLQPSGLADVQERMFLKLGSPRTPRWRKTDSNPSVPGKRDKKPVGYRVRRDLLLGVVQTACRVSRSFSTRKAGFALDSLVEEDGFEPSVPLGREVLERSNISTRWVLLRGGD